MRSMSLLVGSVFLFLSPLLSLGSSDRSHNVEQEKVDVGKQFEFLYTCLFPPHQEGPQLFSDIPCKSLSDLD